jgi:hypothetical protein
LQLLKNCVRESEAFDIVLAVLEWDDSILRIPAPVATRRQLVLDILDHLVPDATRSERAARVLQLGHDCLEPNEIAEFSETIVKSWSTMSSVLEDVKKVKSFLDWAIVENKNADIHARGRLDRLKYEIDSMQESQRNGGVRLQSSYGSEML